jgi:TonB family protein
MAEPRRQVVPRIDAPSVDVQAVEPEPPPSVGVLPFRPGMAGVSFPVLPENSRVLPIYTRLARQAGVSGKVILEAVVRADGSVGEVKVLRSPGAHLGFDEAAIQAVRQWRYRPGMQNGRPVTVSFTVVVEFVLE